MSLSLLICCHMALVVFCAGLVRGATGFGFSLICMVLLTLVFPPAQIAPMVLFWEIAASLGHLPFVYKEADWKALRWLMLGVLPGTPVGAYCLAALPAEPMTVAVNAVALLLTAMLFYGFRLKSAPGLAQTCGVGALTGLINGASANGGPPVILFFLSGPHSAAVGRASLIAFFLFTDVLASLFYWRYGLLSAETFWLGAAFLPCMALGIWLGARWFRRVDEARFRRLTLLLLMAAALAGLARALWLS